MEKMMLYDDREMFVKDNCENCIHFGVPVSERPCNGKIPMRFNQIEWYPDYCPFKIRRPLTDEERKDLQRTIKEVCGERV